MYTLQSYSILYIRSTLHNTTNTMVSSVSLFAASLALFFFSYNCHAFLLPSPHHHPQHQSSISSLCCSMVKTDERSSQHPSSSSSNSNSSIVQSLNIRLDQLAQRCADPKEHVILLASQCEDLFLHSRNNEADTVSFNIHLKAWKNTCATLADNKHKTTTNSAAFDWKIPSHAVYTARDAAERATNILLEMEQTLRQDPNSPIVPDCTSYNIVIGTYTALVCVVCFQTIFFLFVLLIIIKCLCLCLCLFACQMLGPKVE